MTRLAASLFVIALIGLPAGVSTAEPGPAARFLMQAPTSLFSFGLWRLNKNLGLSENNIRNDIEHAGLTYSAQSNQPLVNRAKIRIFADAQYDWDRDRVVIGITIISKFKPAEFAVLCREITNGVRRRGNINNETGKAEFGTSSYAQLFDEIGFNNNSGPKDRLMILDRTFEVLITTRNNKCRSPLLSTKVLIEQ